MSNAQDLVFDEHQGRWRWHLEASGAAVDYHFVLQPQHGAGGREVLAVKNVSPAPLGSDPVGGESLGKSLKSRHVSMIAIGGIIGAGLFVGSSTSIATVGPAVILSYAL